MAETKDQSPALEFQKQRLQSLDAYRGLIMISLAFVAFGLAATSANQLKAHPDSDVWKVVHYQTTHTEWVGCSYWDMIQPSFMFMVGASMAFSYARRQRKGDSYPAMLRHAMVRSVVLILLSIFLMSKSKTQTDWQFMNVLAQIGLGYTFLFLLWGRSNLVQIIAVVLILGGTWLAYENYPYAGINLETGAPEVGVSKAWANEHLKEVRPPWHKNANVGHAVDRWFLNLFPRKEEFKFNRGGYQTINFIPSIATMLFGLMCGQLLQSNRSSSRKFLYLLVSGLLGIAAGEVLHHTGVCPLVKRIWTPSWALYSTGWCCLIMAFLFVLIDVLDYRRWSFPLIVVGMNSILIYCMSMSLKSWTDRQLRIHFGQDIHTLYGTVSSAFTPTVQAVMVGLVFWLVCYYCYRNKIFVRI